MADVLKRTVRADVLLTRNERTLYDQEYYKPDVSFTESTHQRVVLATNMASPQEFDLSGVATGAVIMFTNDRQVNISLNTTGNMITLNNNGMFVATASFTHVYVQNESTTYTATVEFLATD